MRSIGNSLRAGASAIGLALVGNMGLVSVVTLGSVALATAPAAVAQKASSEEFALAYKDASDAYKARDYAKAAQKAEQANGLAKGNSEKSAVAGILAGSYAQTRQYQKAIDAIAAHRALGALPAAVETSYDGILIDAYNQTRQPAKAVEIAKKQIAAGQANAKTYGFVGVNELKAKNYKEAIAMANKAIAASGGKGSEEYWKIIIAAQLETKDMTGYYNTLEKVAPMFNKVEYWKPFIDGVKKSPKFKEGIYGVDLYRTFDAAGVKLTNTDQATWGEQALSRAVPIEADKVLTPLVKAGTFGGPQDPKAERNKGLYVKAQTEAKADKAGGLAKTEAEAAAKPTGATYISVGESYMANGDFQKAVDAFQKGLTKGAMEPGETDYAKLKLGIAQLKAGKKSDAVKTWAEVKGDNGSGWLARCWTAISKA